MSELLFRFVLPAYLALGAVALALKRRHVGRQCGRDPVRLRPSADVQGVGGVPQAVLVLATTALALDVVARAVWPQAAEALLTTPLLARLTALRWTGLALVTTGLGVYFVGLVDLGVSWRIGIDCEAPGPLVTSGIFARVRHPLYAGILAATLGMALFVPDPIAIAATAAAWTAVPIQARLEEEFLAALHPEYAAYQQRTGRFLPAWS